MKVRHKRERVTPGERPRWPELLIVAAALVATVLVTGTTAGVWVVAAPLLVLLGARPPGAPRG